MSLDDIHTSQITRLYRILEKWEFSASNNSFAAIRIKLRLLRPLYAIRNYSAISKGLLEFPEEVNLFRFFYSIRGNTRYLLRRIIQENTHFSVIMTVPRPNEKH